MANHARGLHPSSNGKRNRLFRGRGRVRNSRLESAWSSRKNCLATFLGPNIFLRVYITEAHQQLITQQLITRLITGGVDTQDEVPYKFNLMFEQVGQDMSMIRNARGDNLTKWWGRVQSNTDALPESTPFKETRVVVELGDE